MYHNTMSQGQALAAEMAQLRERAAASEARLAALQRERGAERTELEAARTALAEALEGLDGEDIRAQARHSMKACARPDMHCYMCLAGCMSLFVSVFTISHCHGSPELTQMSPPHVCPVSEPACRLPV